MKRATKNTAARGTRMLKMNGDTYALRREVVGIIYEAKRIIPNLPRVEVRIVEKRICTEQGLAGYAYTGRNIIHILKHVTGNEKELRHVVYHELCHAILSTPHNRQCKLMASHYSKSNLCTKAQCEDIFANYFSN